MQKKYIFVFFCLILALSALLVWDSGLTETNFSVIGNRQGQKLLFLVWGALAGNYYYMYMEALMRQAKCRDRIARALLIVSLCLLMVGIGLPYLPEKLPRLSRLHVFYSFLSTVCMAMTQMRFLFFLQRRTGTSWKTEWFLQAGIAACAIGLLLGLGMVTSLLEIFLVAAVCLYLGLLRRKLEKMQDNL